MSKSNDAEHALLLLIFNNTPWAGIGDAGGLLGSTVAGNLYATLHTADPGEAGTAITNETAYTGYARRPVVRSAAGFTVTLNSVSPVAAIDFGECTASPGAPVTYGAFVDTASGAGTILYSGALTPAITIAAGVIPRLKTTSACTED